VTDPITEAAEALARGDLVVFPTDTVYGLAARPEDAAATKKVFAVKQRQEGLALPILAGSFDDAHRVAEFDERAELLAVAWPGPLTLVLPRAARAMGWNLGGEAGTVGVRIPRHPLALAILARTGPLAVTSANRSGEPPLQDAGSLAAAFGDAVAVYLCQEAMLSGAASTVVDLTGAEPRILRSGEVSEADIARFLAGEGPLLDSRPSL
jgi:tRNA threonylcarbamoyl adenosine modification protein (Sua5/YciO/YrdC/YwlC family)